jgi:hypothetical protein
MAKSSGNAGADKLPVRMDWQAIATAPFDRNIALAVIDARGTHAIAFPCRRVLRGWVKAKDAAAITVYPTHWREWDDAVSPFSSRPAS